jgi:hypothetical protein
VPTNPAEARLQIVTAAQILNGNKPFGFTERFKKGGARTTDADRLL